MCDRGGGGNGSNLIVGDSLNSAGVANRGCIRGGGICIGGGGNGTRIEGDGVCLGGGGGMVTWAFDLDREGFTVTILIPNGAKDGLELGLYGACGRINFCPEVLG